MKLLQLTKEQSLAITKWVEGSTLWDSVTTSGNVVIPIRPDAWFTIGNEQGNAHFFLEADRGTMAHSRMREKISGYAAYFQQRRHVKEVRWHESVPCYFYHYRNPWPRESAL